MFEPFAHEDSDLDRAIADVYIDLTRHKADSDEYQKINNQLTQLYALKNAQAQLTLQAQQSHSAHQLECDKNAWQEEQDQRPFYRRLSPDSCLSVAGNVIVALVVVNYEQRSVISTRVTNFLMKHL